MFPLLSYHIYNINHFICHFITEENTYFICWKNLMDSNIGL